MKKYGSHMLLFGLLCFSTSMFISVHYLYIVQTILFFVSFIIYILSDNSSLHFLKRFKYFVLLIMLSFFFIQVNRDGGDMEFTSENVTIAYMAIFLQTALLLFVLVRIDRITYQSSLND